MTIRRCRPVVDGVHGAADHAVGVGAGAARGGDDEAVEAQPVAQQARDGHAVGGASVFLHAAACALVAAGAAVEVEHEDAAPFIEPLFHVIVQESLAHALAAQAGEGEVHEAAAQEREPAHHFQKIPAAEGRQLHMTQRRTGGGAQAGRDGRADPPGREGLPRGRHPPRRRSGANRSGTSRAGQFRRGWRRGRGRTLGLRPRPAQTDADIPEADEVERSGAIALLEEGLPGADADGDARAHVVHDFAVGLVVEVLEQLAIRN